MRGAVVDARAPRSRAVVVVALLSIVGWAVPALVMLDRGFAVQDEGTYVLSYRYWSSNPYFVSGAQYFYGPIFEGLGESIPLLRLLRLLMVLGANACFAWCFVRWLGERSARLPAFRPALVMLVIASGGMAYLWTPLTPGYYDLAADSCLVLVSLLLLTLSRPGRPPAWVMLLTGVLAVVLVITKWTAFTVPLLTIGLSLWWAKRSSPSAVVRSAVLLLAGIGAGLLVVQLWLIPLDRLVAVMRQVSSLNAAANHSLKFLEISSGLTTVLLLSAACVVALPLLFGLVAAHVAVRRGDERAAWRALVGVAVATMVAVPLAVGWRGGDSDERAVIALVLGSLIVALVAGLWFGDGPLPGGSQGRWVALVLAVVPFLQAAGTNVALLHVAAECTAMWVALALTIAARGDSPTHAAPAVLVNLLVLVVGVALIGGSNTLLTPFKTGSFSEDTASVPQLGVRVGSAEASQYRALTAALAPYLVPGSTPVLALDRKAGLIYLVGGVPVGSTWTDPYNVPRTAGIVALACRNGDVSPDPEPVLVLDRPVDPALGQALTGCGFDYPAGYREIAVPSGPPGVRVLVPRAPA